MMIPELNREIAERLKEVAELLHNQGSNPFRVQAYRHAAHTLEQLRTPVDEILRSDGLEGLEKLPAIGESLSRSIKELILTGKLPMLQRLRGEVEPVALLASIPGIGKKLADQLHHELGIDTLEELEVAAHDGRLTQIPGIGEKRLSGIIASLAERLGRVRGKIGPTEKSIPSIEEILDVDCEYREKATADKLHKFAPRRFNPTGEAWLPVLHTQRGQHHYTALFSNTARAHKKGKTHDWVVLYYDDGQKDSQCTVITAEWGILESRRIVSGRESECLLYYEEQQSKATEASHS
ncbi:MAG: DNA-binding protein [Nitrospirota bacterium]|nr:MAG: DNA-binding protein [Nitrospirota bacterium]